MSPSILSHHKCRQRVGGGGRVAYDVTACVSNRLPYIVLCVIFRAACRQVAEGFRAHVNEFCHERQK